MKKKTYLEFIFLIILGAFTSLSLPPYNYLIINFATLSLFFIFIYKKKKLSNFKNSFLYGWFFGLGYFLTNLYWITISLTFDENFNFLIPLALFLIPSFLAVFYGLATYFFFRINVNKPLSNLFLFSFSFGLIEFLRGNILTGFPWNLIAFSFSENLEILQIISSIGTYGFNILCISFFTSPAIFILKENRKELLVCIFFLISSIVLYYVGSLKIKSFESSNIIKNDFIIRAVGSKINLNRFFGKTDTKSVINELIEISQPDLNTKTIFLWPEGIVPNIDQSEIKEFEFLFNEKFGKNHLLAFGVNSFQEDKIKGKFYNTFSIYDHKLNLLTDYKKVKLVPFGEFLPFEKILGKMGLKSLTNNYQSFSSGEKREIILISKNEFNIKILPLICYEIIYSGNIFSDSEFDLIINISEDGWFGNSIGPHQHFTHSIFRSIESGKYLIRSSNNGISAIINPTGNIEKKIAFGQSGYIDFYETRVFNETLFSKYGNKMFLIIILLYIFLIFSFNRIS
ncbi:apolipoprotein N-acyltransferase [Pelagibacterales bacterium SAG-MED09]|nr:apolipoprotein N-acyltransferase [Pelagibacterales bacterium SAG-MED09]